MRGMILAAGKGTRLRPLTDSVPKPLIEVAGRPMIAFPLQLLREAEIREVVINLHHLGDQIRVRLGDGSAYGVRITYSEENPILDTGGAIAAARAFLAGDLFVLLNADTFIELHLQDVIAFHRRQGALVTVVVRRDPDAVRKDDIGVDATQRIRRFLGHTTSDPVDEAEMACAAETLIRCFYAGVMVFDPSIFQYCEPGIYSLTRDVFPRLLAAGEKLSAYVHDGYWRVLDTPADLAAGRREILERIGGTTRSS